MRSTTVDCKVERSIPGHVVPLHNRKPYGGNSVRAFLKDNFLCVRKGALELESN